MAQLQPALTSRAIVVDAKELVPGRVNAVPGRQDQGEGRGIGVRRDGCRGARRARVESNGARGRVEARHGRAEGAVTHLSTLAYASISAWSRTAPVAGQTVAIMAYTTSYESTPTRMRCTAWYVLASSYHCSVNVLSLVCIIYY